MSLSTTPSAEGPISFDQAVTMMRDVPAGVPEREEEPAAAVAEPEQVEEADQTEQPESDATPPAEDVPAEAPEPNGETEVEALEPEAPAIKAPHWWAAEAKASFANLPPELQTVVLEQEKNRDRAISQAQQKATEAAKLADIARSASEAKATEITQFLERANAVLPAAEAAHKSKWDNIDWVRWAHEDPAAYTANRAIFEAETAQLQQLVAAKQTADGIAEKQRQDEAAKTHQEWAQGEAAKLATLVPDFVDPKEGKTRIDATVSFAKSAGFTAEQINNADASLYALAYDAMRWRQAQAAAKPPSKPAPTPARPALRPPAAQATTSTQRSATEAMTRLTKSGSTDDAVRALQALRRKG